MTAVPPPADEQACICPRKAVGSVRHSECPVHGFEAARAAADELDKYIAHTMDCESVMLEGYPCICGSIAAIAAEIARLRGEA